MYYYKRAIMTEGILLHFGAYFTSKTALPPKFGYPLENCSSNSIQMTRIGCG